MRREAALPLLKNIIGTVKGTLSGSSWCRDRGSDALVDASRVMSIFRKLVIARPQPLCFSSLLKSCATHSTLLFMPPKRGASSSKRKAGPDSDGEKPVGSKTTKKAKVDASPNLAEDTGLAPNGQPTNKVLPVKISFPPRSERATRIASWNICSLASSQKKVGLTRLS